VTSPAIPQFELSALDDMAKAFTVNCPDPSAATRPFELRTEWVPPTAPPGSAVALDLVLDLTAVGSQNVGGVPS